MCLAAHEGSLFGGHTPENVKLLPPPRQSRGASLRTSDIDLMIISDSLTYGEVFGALERVTRALGRKVNPTVYTAAEFSKRARTENAFVTRVLEQPKLWVIGSEDDLPVAA